MADGGETRGVHPWVTGRRHRVALMVVLVAAAMPVRTPVSVPLINSVSVLDLLLGLVAVTLVIDCAFRPLDIGYPQLFVLLCLPLAVCGLSLAWSQDKAATVRSAVIYAEGIIAYLFVLRELRGASPDAVMTYIKRYTYLLIIPGVLLLLHVPGFAPAEPDLSPTSDRYLSYYTRLSHPVLGPSNNLATALAFFIPVLLYWGHVKRDRRYTRAGFIALVAVFCTLSRGVALALLIMALLAAASNMVRRRGINPRAAGKTLVAGAVVVGGILLLYKFNPNTQEFFQSRFSLANVGIRSGFASAAKNKIIERPLLGFGGGVAPDDVLDLARVHNTYLQQALNFGLLLGLVVSLSLIGTAFFFFSRSRTSIVARTIGFAILAQLLIFAVESSFEGSVLRVLFYLSVGLVAALARACEVQEPLDSSLRREAPSWEPRPPPERV